VRRLMEPLAEEEPQPDVYTITMRELNQNTAQVIDEINKSGRQALVTKHGRYVAVIRPVSNVEVEIGGLSTDSSSVRVLVSSGEQNS
jgi:prevent-host-death family protein